MSLVMGIADLWRSGMKKRFLVLKITHQTGMEDVGGDSHFATF